MPVSNNPSVVMDSLLLNVDFANKAKCYNPRENLVSYSNYNAAAWSNVFTANATLTTGIDAPDGTLTAVRMTCNTAGNSLLRITIPSHTADGLSTYTISFYVRRISGTTAQSNVLQVDLQDDSGKEYNYLPSLVTNQWVRVTYSFVPSAGTKTNLDLLNNNTNDYVLDFWGVQLEKSFSATNLTPTSGTAVSRGTTVTDSVGGTSHTLTNARYWSYDDSTDSIDFRRNETTAAFTASISGTTLDVTAVSSGTLAVGQAINYTGNASTKYISALGTGTGGVGTYTINTSATVSSTSMTSGEKIGGFLSATVSGNLGSSTYLYNDHTTEIWAKINDRTPIAIDFSETNSTLVCYVGYHSMFLYTSGSLRYIVWNGTGPTELTTTPLTIGTSGTNVIQGQWFCVAVTKSGSTYKTYLNGTLRSTDTLSVTSFGSISNVLRVGTANYAVNPGSYHYQGEINVGALKMYNTALTEAQIKQNFDALRGRYGL